MNPFRKKMFHLSLPSKAELETAIKNSDKKYNGIFFYGLIRANIFCKPSCEARTKKSEDIHIFYDTQSAKASGFKPCKKCRPETLRPDLEKMVNVARHIENRADHKLTLDELSQIAGLSNSHLQKSFKSAMGVSPKKYQDAIRLANYKNALKSGETITDAIYSSGFSSPSRIYGEISRSMGMTPSKYQSGGEGEEIFYATRYCSLGLLLMAATYRGVCFAQFGDSSEDLIDMLVTEFPKAHCRMSSKKKCPELIQWIKALDAHVKENAPHPDLPLDLRGTSFQLMVWQFLLGTKSGDVLSYTELAEGIGKPKAVRAAATACGANRVGILVPCHRVLRGDGNLGGYRWGLSRKKALLEAEQRNRTA